MRVFLNGEMPQKFPYSGIESFSKFSVATPTDRLLSVLLQVISASYLPITFMAQ